jgi:hypothetical protein
MRRHVEAAIWSVMFERWGYYGELPLMLPRTVWDRVVPWCKRTLAAAILFFLALAGC